MLFFAGCDPAYRIRRDSDHLNYTVPFDCLMSSIRNSPRAKLLSNDVQNPKYVCEEGQASRQILYSVNGETITLTGCYQGEVIKAFSQYRGGWVGGQKSEKISTVLESMREIERTIERHCNVKGFTSEIKNNCLRIDCGG